MDSRLDRSVTVVSWGMSLSIGSHFYPSHLLSLPHPDLSSHNGAHFKALAFLLSVSMWQLNVNTASMGAGWGYVIK